MSAKLPRKEKKAICNSFDIVMEVIFEKVKKIKDTIVIYTIHFLVE